MNVSVPEATIAALSVNWMGEREIEAPGYIPHTHPRHGFEGEFPTVNGIDT